MDRKDVWICNVLKCRPPGNRDPHPKEIESCQDYLHRQIELIEPVMICTLGNFSTKLLRADSIGISRLHGQEEVRVIGPRAVRLYPLYHPAAALYTPSTLEMLRADFQRIPEVLALGPPPQPEPAAPELESVGAMPDLADLEPDDANDPGERGRFNGNADPAPRSDARDHGFHEPEPAAQLGLF
jgi:DNA polymerase